MVLPRAEESYSVNLEPAAGARFPHPYWFKALWLTAAGQVGLWSGPPAGEMVITRNAPTPEVVHRQAAGDDEAAAYLLDHVQQQLHELDVAAFESAWSLSPGACSS